MLQKIKKNGSELAAHPAAEIFPMLDEKQLQELAADIEQHGQQEAIETYQGQILDGRNRLLACRLAKVDPLVRDITVELKDKKLTPLQYVISKNLHRRHLTESQRAMVAESLASSKHGGDRKSDNKNQESNLSLEKSAEQLNVSKTSVKNARTVKRSGDKELVKQVVSGKKKVSKAAAEVKARSPKKKAVKKKAVKKKTAAPKESTSDCKPVSPYSWPESEIKIQAVTEAFLKSVESGDFKGEFWFTTDEDFGSVLLAFVSRVFDKADNKLKASIEKQWKIVVEWEPGCNVLSPFWALKIPKILSALMEGGSNE